MEKVENNTQKNKSEEKTLIWNLEPQTLIRKKKK